MIADTSHPAPMVNGDMLRKLPGRRVTCMLRVVRAEGGVITGVASDGAHVVAKQVPDMPDGLQTYVQVVGIAERDGSVHTEICVNCGDNFNMEHYNKLCALAHGPHNDIF